MTTMTFLVSETDTASSLGSGDVPVLATPRLLAWFEAATVTAVAGHLADGQTSVGVEVSLRHLRATPVGGRVLVAVTSESVADKRAEFDVVGYELADPQAEALAAQHSTGASPAAEAPPGAVIIATAHITRAVVDRAAFVARLLR